MAGGWTLRGGSWRGVVLGVAAALSVIPAAAQSPSVVPLPSGSTFVSQAYGYSIALPSGWEATPAKVAWDGSSRVDSTGGYPDDFNGPRGILFFVFGAPTELGLADYAAQQQQNTATWHGCPATPDAAADAEISGVPARVHTFGCQGYTIHKLMAVRDGRGLVVNQIALPGDPNASTASFLSRVAAIAWPGTGATPSPSLAPAATSSPSP